MFKIAIAIITVLFCQVGATELPDNGYAEVSADVSVMNINDVIVAHTNWYFLGCVHDQQDCHHHADAAGYHHNSSTYDPSTCHHDHHNQWACYVKP